MLLRAVQDRERHLQGRSDFRFVSKPASRNLLACAPIGAFHGIDEGSRHGVEARVELVGAHALPQTSSGKLSRSKARALFLAQQKSLLWKHEVTDSTFQRSYRYYGIHGKDLNEIYAGVIDTLGKREARLTPATATQPAANQWGPPPAKTN